MSRFAIILLATALLAATAHACPMCKDSVANTDASNAAALPGGFNASIYVMLGGFFAVLSFVGGVIYRGVKSSDPSNH